MTRIDPRPIPSSRDGLVPPQSAGEDGSVDRVAARCLVSLGTEDLLLRSRDRLQPLVRDAWRGCPVFVGTVIATEPPHYDTPGFQLPAFLHRVLLIAEFIALPVVLIPWLMVYAGPLSTLLGVAFLLLLIRLLMPGNLLSLMWLARLFNPRRSLDQVQVRYLRLRADDGQEVAIRMEGRLIGSNVMPGDRLAVWGVVHRGTLNLRRAVNLHTGATTHVRANSSWIPLLINVTVLSIVLGLLAGPMRTFGGFAGGR